MPKPLAKFVVKQGLHCCPLASRASFTTQHCLRILLILLPHSCKYRACCVLFHIVNNNAGRLALPRISQGGEEEQNTSAGFSSEMETLQRQPPCHCWTTICVSEARKSSHTLCLPDAGPGSSGLPITPGLLVSFSSPFVLSSIHDRGKMPCYSFSTLDPSVPGYSPWVPYSCKPRHPQLQ